LRPKKKKNKPQCSKPRFCDPGACDCCQYIGDGDFLCDDHQTIVVSDWEPTEDYMICRRRKVKVKNGG
jgi:hypothetical protein